MKCACFMLSSVAYPALQYFFTLSHKQHDFRKIKTVIEHGMCFGFLYSLFSETFLTPRRIERDTIKKMYIGLHVKVPLFLLDFN
jgi:hypothetical protein